MKFLLEYLFIIELKTFTTDTWLIIERHDGVRWLFSANVVLNDKTHDINGYSTYIFYHVRKVLDRSSYCKLPHGDIPPQYSIIVIN